MQEGGITPSGELVTSLRVYIEELHSWNQHTNLTGLKTMEEMAIKHIGDTLTLIRVLPEDVHHVLDIGTGPGVPGFILKLFRPDLEIVLVDAVRKKVSFLNTMIAKIGLKGIWAEHCRVSPKDIPRHSPPEGFDIIVSQAVGPLDELARMARPLMSANGLVIAMKGPKIDEELEGKIGYLQRHGWKTSIIKTQTPVGSFRRNLIMLRRY
ncbi:MAG: 16S rRNA (guanine(527)-N(7))-methyltransferase RsmG [Deltaproteobacteria bacterium]|nr:16S rRNA (guanine(527)-N(7))-methyltransferase RsmG [Deltaproteobacteria bacterium]